VLSQIRETRSLRLFAGCALMQVGHGGYYAFYTLRLQDLGYPGWAIGSLWALAVLCEVGLLSRADDLVEKLGTPAVQRMSLVAAAVRWLVIGFLAVPVALVLAQVLHALTYAAFHVASLREVHRRFGPGRRATGQALYSGLTYGLGIFTGTLLAGALVDRAGYAGLFLFCAAMPLLAIAVLGRSAR
jgi:PPP family 3-phenylpropionic acid transporter